MAGKKDFSKQQNPAMTFITPQEAQEALAEEIHTEAAQSAAEACSPAEGHSHQEGRYSGRIQAEPAVRGDKKPSLAASCPALPL